LACVELYDVTSIFRGVSISVAEFCIILPVRANSDYLE
jgi:hypothetical protein